MSAQSKAIFINIQYISLSTFLHLSLSLCTLCLSHSLFYPHETKLFVYISSNDIDKFDKFIHCFVSQSQHLTERPPAQFTVTSTLMLSCTRSSPLYAPHSHSHRAHAHKHTRTHTRTRTCTRTPTCLPRLICELFTPHIAPRPHTNRLSNATNGLMIDDQLTLVFGNWVNL